MGVVYYPGVAMLGLVVTFLGLVCFHRLSVAGPAHAGPPARSQACIASLLLAVVFPSGLILANTRATFEAFFSSRMDFNRTTRVGEIQKGGWRGVPELVVGVFVADLSPSPNANWSALFFFFAVSGLVSIGAMGAIAPARRAPADHAGRMSRDGKLCMVNARLKNSARILNP